MTPTLQGESALIEVGVAGRTLPGQARSGDLHLVKPFRNGVLLAVADGVGHGDWASAAAHSALAALAENPSEPLIWLVRHCHERLKRTRGVVMTLASVHSLDGTITWLGVGNVEGLLLRADPRAVPPSERVLLRGGLVGLQLPALYASVVPISAGDLFILASDGVNPDFASRLVLRDSPQQVADRILNRHLKGSDDALVLVARYLGLHHE